MLEKYFIILIKEKKVVAFANKHQACISEASSGLTILLYTHMRQQNKTIIKSIMTCVSY